MIPHMIPLVKRRIDGFQWVEAANEWELLVPDESPQSGILFPGLIHLDK